MLNDSIHSHNLNMLKHLLFALVAVGISFTVSAQTVVTSNGNKSKQPVNEQVQAKLGLGQSLTIAPNPLQAANAVLTVTTIGVDYYSYTVYNAMGQIVELENLSGRPDSTYIDLNGAVHPGMYVIIFDTNAGKVNRKFNVI